jgi:hypothetical protein
MYSFSTSLSGCTVPPFTTGLHGSPVHHRLGERLADLLGQIFEVHATTTCERDGTLHGIFQLAHVARPLVA